MGESILGCGSKVLGKSEKVRWNKQTFVWKTFKRIHQFLVGKADMTLFECSTKVEAFFPGNNKAWIEGNCNRAAGTDVINEIAECFTKLRLLFMCIVDYFPRL